MMWAFCSEDDQVSTFPLIKILHYEHAMTLIQIKLILTDQYHENFTFY